MGLKFERPEGEKSVPMARLAPRDRIVATARDLFHRYGVRGIGVDAIAEAAATNKMTLYRHFESKDLLIVECLRQAAEESSRIWLKLEAAYPGNPREQLHAWLRKVAEYVMSDRRGCDMANAAVELCEPDHPAHQVINEFKMRQRACLVDLCRRAGLSQPETLADTLYLVLEGARVSRLSTGPEGPSSRLVSIGEAIIAGFDRSRAPEEVGSAICEV